VRKVCTKYLSKTLIALRWDAPERVYESIHKRIFYGILISMYERKKNALLSRAQFTRRLLRHFGLASVVILSSLFVGMAGYHFLEHLSWLDSCLNASMLLGGMGPVDQIHTSGGKLFASFYALFSGIIFLVGVGIILAPVAHRMIHRFHLDLNDQDKRDTSK